MPVENLTRSVFYDIVMIDLVKYSFRLASFNSVSAIFGQCLADTMAYEARTSNRKVPRIVEMCVEYLLKHGVEMEGIFRYLQIKNWYTMLNREL